MRTPHLFLLAVLVLAMSGCATTHGILTGSVSTAFTEEPKGRREFVILLPNPLSLQDRQIGDRIEKKLIERGYTKAPSTGHANVAVRVRYAIGEGNTEVHSSPDFVWGGKEINTSTSYPRFFELIMVDLTRSNLPDDFFVIWQGEVKSEGSSTNMERLAEYFIDTLFEHYGETVKGKRFGKFVTL